MYLFLLYYCGLLCREIYKLCSSTDNGGEGGGGDAFTHLYSEIEPKILWDFELKRLAYPLCFSNKVKRAIGDHVRMYKLKIIKKMI